jgi:hypothetical protein
MEPGQVLVALLYLWLLIAVGVYGWRAYRRLVHRETRKDRVAPSTATGAPTARPASTGPAPGPADEDRPRPIPPSGPGSGRQGVFAPSGAGVTPTPAEPIRPAGGGRPTVAELVAGIALPCGLIPVVTGAELDPHHVVFATTGHGAGEVGSALADELERLGFELRTETDTEAVAVRDDASLRVRIRREGDEPGAPAPLPGDPVRVIAELSS